MAKFDFWKWYVEKDDYILAVFDFLRNAKSWWGLKDMKLVRTGHAIIKAHFKESEDVVILLNGPSINKQPLERIKGKDIVCVNQGFRHPLYASLAPKYHVFVDTKMIHGIWDVKWLDTILNMVPNIIFAMPASWARTHLFDEYITRGIPIIWLDSSYTNIRCHGVSGTAFRLAEALGYKRIYFTGYEATSFASMILSQASHFYGSDSDEAMMTDSDIMKGYYMNARHIREVILSAERLKHKGIEVFNLTKGGILNMFERLRFEDVFPSHLK